MPPRDPEFGPDVGGDGLTIPCYLADGNDDPGLLEWCHDHPDWFVAGTWTSQSSAADPPRSGETSEPATTSAPSPRPRSATDPKAAPRALVGKGRTIPPLDPATISLADFREVVTREQNGGEP